MDILESDLAPVSFDPPTSVEVRKSEELEAYLRYRFSLLLSNKQISRYL